MDTYLNEVEKHWKFILLGYNPIEANPAKQQTSIIDACIYFCRSMESWYNNINIIINTFMFYCFAEN